MIGIIAKNNLTRTVLMDALIAFQPQVYQSSDNTPDLIVLYHTPSFIDGFFKTPVPCPVLVLGSAHEEADICLPTPCRLSVLMNALSSLLEDTHTAPLFENKVFVFNGKNRQLLNKETEELIHLTEKENALMTYLAQHAGTKISKETLLSEVWNYHPETETHTVESHIYALRQKITFNADDLIQSDDGGYSLVV